MYVQKNSNKIFWDMELIIVYLYMNRMMIHVFEILIRLIHIEVLDFFGFGWQVHVSRFVCDEDKNE